MAVFPTLLLLLGALAGSTLAVTKFVFSGEVTCLDRWYHQNFNYRILVYEDDICNDDLISGGLSSPSHLQVMSPHFYNITVTAHNDGMLDNNFEIVFVVVHDCITHLNLEKITTLKARFEVGTYEINQKTHYITKNMDLSNVGTKWNKIVRKAKKGFCSPGCNCAADP